MIVLDERCETPESPPGDYNFPTSESASNSHSVTGVKHLNPRQGITTSEGSPAPAGLEGEVGVKHLNPRQGITSVAETKHSEESTTTVPV